MLVNYDLKGLEERKSIQSSGDIDASKARKVVTEIQPSTSEKVLTEPTLPPVESQDIKADIPSTLHLSSTQSETSAEALPVSVLLYPSAVDLVQYPEY